MVHRRDHREAEPGRISALPTHPDGRNKLRLWRGVFGIGEGDAELLERLLREQLPQAEPDERPPNAVRGPKRVIRQWQLLIPRFRGPNDNEGPVKTGWAVDTVYADGRGGRGLYVEVSREDGATVGFVDLEVGENGSLDLVAYTPFSSR